MSTSGSITPESNPLLIELTTKNFSNICKRLVANLTNSHQVTITHTQARTAMAKSLGFDSPSELDVLLREADSKTKAASPRAPSTVVQDDTVKSDDEKEARNTREEELRTLLQIPIQRDAKGTAVNLGNLTLSLLAQVFPAKLDEGDKAAIKRIYPAATSALIRERAMNHEGVITALSLAVEMARIAIDYYPLSDSSRYIAHDKHVAAKVGSELGAALTKAYDLALTQGMTPFGASTTLILLSGVSGLKHGVAWSALARTLLEAIELIVKHGTTREFSPDTVERAIRALMSEMGISRKEAQKYADFVRNNPDYK